jgi:hypothetical protein
MKQQPIDLFTMSNVRFTTTALAEDDNSCFVVAIQFCGKYGYGSLGNGDGRFMAAVTHAVDVAWRPSGLVLDLRELEYEFGNTILEVILFGQGDGGWPPTRIVVSEKCESGLRSLLQCGGRNPDEWLCRTVEEAYEKVKLLVSMQE